MRLRSLLSFCLVLPLFSLEACSCDPALDDGTTPPPDTSMCGGNVCPSTGACILLPDDLSPLCAYDVTGYNFGYCDSANVVFNPTTCAYECSQCTGPAPLKAGFMAQYLDAVSVNGTNGETVSISGYSPGYLDAGYVFFGYGDLVYAEFTPGGSEVVSWTILDGSAAPNSGNVYADPNGWRQGVYCYPDPDGFYPPCDDGPDVGRYSTIAANPTNGDLYIAYSDFDVAGSYQLKLAHRTGTTWSVSVIDGGPGVEPVATGGAYFETISMLNGTIPVVAYGVRQQATAPGSQPTGWIRVATATSANPQQPSDWTYADLGDTTANVGCVDGDGMCAAGDRCFAAGTSGRGECATPTNDCTTTCAGMLGTVSLCVDTVCRNVKKGIDLIDTVGVGIDMQPVGGGFGLVYHDRGAGFLTGAGCDTDADCGAIEFCSGIRDTNPTNKDGFCMIPNGNVWGKRFDGNTWSNRFLIDGYSRKNSLVGDSGQHVSLAIDNTGVWHVAYLDGTFDRIRYAQVQTNDTISQYAFVDDGTPGATRPTDRIDGRRRLLGGDMSVVITDAGQVRIMYQDLTGPDFNDPTGYPPGAQPVLATRAAAGATLDPWTITYGAPNLSNAGWWVTQAISANPTGVADSWCIWADRLSNRNTPDINYSSEEDGADTHVLNCAP